MSDQRTAPARGAHPADASDVITRFFGAIALYISQVIDEMRKVVRPTRQELTSYTIVVIVFVTVVMLFVFGLDTLFTKLVFWAFAG